MRGTVVIDQRRPSLSYHRKSTVPTMIGMEEVTEEQAIEMGCVPCSHCFAKQDNVQYPYDYFTTHL